MLPDTCPRPGKEDPAIETTCFSREKETPVTTLEALLKGRKMQSPLEREDGIRSWKRS